SARGTRGSRSWDEPDPQRSSGRSRGTDDMEYRPPGSLRLDAGKLDHLAPLLGFVGDEFPEFSGGHKCRLEAHVEEAHLHLRIGNDCVDLVVEPVNNVGGRIFRGANTLPTARLVAGDKFVHGWDVWPLLQPCPR